MNYDEPTDRKLFPVSCKVAFFSRDLKAVLLVEQRSGIYGLPGGHMERKETPDEAARREVREEIGIMYTDELQPINFFLHKGRKIVLGFAGVLAMDTAFNLDPYEITSTRWTTLAELKDEPLLARGYQELVQIAQQRLAS